MRYVRVRFTDKEYSKVKRKANASNVAISRLVYNEVLKKDSDDIIKKYYYFNKIINLLQTISKQLKNGKYTEENTTIFSYLYLIEKKLMKKL